MNFIHQHFSHHRDRAKLIGNWKLETYCVVFSWKRLRTSFSSLSFGMIQASLALLSLLRQLTLFRPCFLTLAYPYGLGWLPRLSTVMLRFSSLSLGIIQAGLILLSLLRRLTTFTGEVATIRNVKLSQKIFWAEKLQRWARIATFVQKFTQHTTHWNTNKKK